MSSLRGLVVNDLDEIVLLVLGGKEVVLYDLREMSFDFRVPIVL